MNRRDWQNFVAGAAAGFLLTWTLMPCSVKGAELAPSPCAHVIAPPAELLPYQGPLARVVRPLRQVGIICRSFGVLDSRTICGCSLYGRDQNMRTVMIQIVASVPEQKLIEDHEDAHGNSLWWHR